MPDKPWKAVEREAAALFGGARFKANTGGELDFETNLVIGQVKHRKHLSLAALTKLAMAMDEKGNILNKLPVIVAKVRQGAGRASPMLIIITAESFDDWFSFAVKRYDNQSAP